MVVQLYSRQLVTCEAVPIPLYGGFYLHTILSKIVSWLFHDQMLCFKADNMYTDAYLKVFDRPFW